MPTYSRGSSEWIESAIKYKLQRDANVCVAMMDTDVLWNDAWCDDGVGAIVRRRRSARSFVVLVVFVPKVFDGAKRGLYLWAVDEFAAHAQTARVVAL